MSSIGPATEILNARLKADPEKDFDDALEQSLAECREICLASSRFCVLAFASSSACGPVVPAAATLWRSKHANQLAVQQTLRTPPGLLQWKQTLTSVVVGSTAQRDEHASAVDEKRVSIPLPELASSASLPLRLVDENRFSYRIGFIPDNMKRDKWYYPATAYSTLAAADLGLCASAFRDKKQCSRGADCLFRHHPLLDSELEHPRLRKGQKVRLRINYYPQEALITKWEDLV